jgi:hypothetical protein
MGKRPRRARIHSVQTKQNLSAAQEVRIGMGQICESAWGRYRLLLRISLFQLRCLHGEAARLQSPKTQSKCGIVSLRKALQRDRIASDLLTLLLEPDKELAGSPIGGIWVSFFRFNNHAERMKPIPLSKCLNKLAWCYKSSMSNFVEDIAKSILIIVRRQ